MKILISGATSAIAQSTARTLLSQSDNPCHFVLLGRNEERLEMIANDLTARGAESVFSISTDLANCDDIESHVDQAWNTLESIDVAIIAQGTLPEQNEIQNSWTDIKAAYDINALSYMALMTALASKMETLKKGCIVVVSSVAGDRGRQSNYIYGSAKGAVSLFAQGLRNRLFKHGINVITVKPGFVDTPMTDGMNKDGPLWSSPERVASDIVTAIDKNRSTVYTPGFWRLIMLVIQHIPDFIFKRLSL